MDIPLPLILDGATGTALMERGMPQGACTEQWILDHPQILVDLQRAYVDAGSGLLAAPTFGANPISLARHGIPESQVEDYNRRLLALSRQAADGRTLVAADISPVGLFLPPFGETSFQELVDSYARQAAALTDADLFLLETFTSLHEARAALLAIRQVSDKPVVVSFTCDENGRTMWGTDVLAALIVMQGMGAAAFGLNCSAGPETMLPQLVRLAEYADIPLLAKPNAGLPTLEGTTAHYHCPPEELASYVPAFAQAGVRLFGGCCGTGPHHIAALKKAVGAVDFSQFHKGQRDPDVIPCATEKEARFITPDVDTGDALACTPDLLEDILEAEEAPIGALKIAIWDEDDLAIFGENQYAVQDALCLETDVPELLEGALRLYQGRAFWDGTSPLEPEFLEQMRKKYGLILL